MSDVSSRVKLMGNMQAAITEAMSGTMERYGLYNLAAATEEQLREYIENEFKEEISA